jgi:hypothetical protein
MLARYYSSSLGRFMAVDPGNDISPQDPQSWNKYAYVRNNPMNRTDPTGTLGLDGGLIQYEWKASGGQITPTAPLTGSFSKAFLDKTVNTANGGSVRVQVLYAEGEKTAGGKLTGETGIVKATINSGTTTSGPAAGVKGQVEIKVFTTEATGIAGSDGAKLQADASVVKVGADVKVPVGSGTMSAGGEVIVCGAGGGGGLDTTKGTEAGIEAVPGIGGSIHGGPVKSDPKK